jgi:hypothetical protein
MGWFGFASEENESVSSLAVNFVHFMAKKMLSQLSVKCLK